jgi:CheY-like chemotaxis protein
LRAADQPLDWNGEASYLFRQASGIICLVEDFADSRLVLKSLLENRGYRVIDFEDAESASSEIPNRNPDVAIIDICLPGKSGLELAAELRQSPATRNIFLIALTACGQRADIEQIYAAGFDRHLVKPSGFGDLCRLIEGRSRLERPVAEDCTCPRAVASSSPRAGSLPS